MARYIVKNLTNGAIVFSSLKITLEPRDSTRDSYDLCIKDSYDKIIENSEVKFYIAKKFIEVILNEQPENRNNVQNDNNIPISDVFDLLKQSINQNKILTEEIIKARNIQPTQIIERIIENKTDEKTQKDKNIDVNVALKLSNQNLENTNIKTNFDKIGKSSKQKSEEIDNNVDILTDLDL